MKSDAFRGLQMVNRVAWFIASGMLLVSSSLLVQAREEESILSSEDDDIVISCFRRPLIEYRFEAIEGIEEKEVDNSGCGPKLDGVVFGEAELQAGAVNSGLEFDGDTTFVEVEDSEDVSFSSGVVVDAFARPDSEKGGAIASKWYGFQDQWILGSYDHGIVYFRVFLKDGTSPELTFLVPDYVGRWLHVAGIYEVRSKNGPASMKLLIDGEIVQQALVNGEDVRIADGSMPIHIGDAGPGTYWARFHGLIDEVRIFGCSSDNMISPSPAGENPSNDLLSAPPSGLPTTVIINGNVYLKDGITYATDTTVRIDTYDGTTWGTEVLALPVGQYGNFSWTTYLRKGDRVRCASLGDVETRTYDGDSAYMYFALIQEPNVKEPKSNLHDSGDDGDEPTP